MLLPDGLLSTTCATIAYLVQIAPISIVRFLGFRVGVPDPGHGWTIFASVCFASSGMMNALLWLLTGRQFGFTSPPEDDDELGDGGPGDPSSGTGTGATAVEAEDPYGVGADRNSSRTGGGGGGGGSGGVGPGSASGAIGMAMPGGGEADRASSTGDGSMGRRSARSRRRTNASDGASSSGAGAGGSVVNHPMHANKAVVSHYGMALPVPTGPLASNAGVATAFPHGYQMAYGRRADLVPISATPIGMAAGLTEEEDGFYDDDGFAPGATGSYYEHFPAGIGVSLAKRRGSPIPEEYPNRNTGGYGGGYGHGSSAGPSPSSSRHTPGAQRLSRHSSSRFDSASHRSQSPINAGSVSLAPSPATTVAPVPMSPDDATDRPRRSPGGGAQKPLSEGNGSIASQPSTRDRQSPTVIVTAPVSPTTETAPIPPSPSPRLTSESPRITPAIVVEAPPSSPAE
jgi:hypothetical protein